MSKKLEVTLVRGLQGFPETQRRTIRSMGLKRREQTVVLEPNKANVGKLQQVRHLVKVREV